MVIKKYKTISSDNKNTFDEEVNSHLDKGWEILDNSYKMNKIYMGDVNVDVRVYKSDSDEYDIHSDSSSGYLSESFSQVVVYKDKKENEVSFDESGHMYQRIILKDGTKYVKCRYHKNGQLEQQEHYKDGKRNGDYTSYLDNGQLQVQGNYRDGQLNGEYKVYFEFERVLGKICNYKDGILDGKCVFHYFNGNINIEGNYKGGNDPMELQTNDIWTNTHLSPWIDSHLFSRGIKEGKWIYYKLDGVIEKEEYYHRNKLIPPPEEN
tara:strand:+ start:173 stop:967 length:795 start_codon:yes stop_codon:yes gene_type:complete